MECCFCGKDHSLYSICKEKKESLLNFDKIIKDHIIDCISLHHNQQDGLGAEDLARFFAQYIINTDHRNYWLNKIASPAAIVRKNLKDIGAYLRAAGGRSNKIRETNKNRYGVINYSQTRKQRDKLSERNNAEVFKINKDEFFLYQRKVEKLTNKTKKKLGDPVVDYYTNLPFLKELNDPFLMQGDLYPTIDHKLSIMFCFYSNMEPEICADVSNLCWTFRIINSRKTHLTDSMFRDTLLPIILPDIRTAILELIEKEGYTPCMLSE